MINIKLRDTYLMGNNESEEATFIYVGDRSDQYSHIGYTPNEEDKYFADGSLFIRYQSNGNIYEFPDTLQDIFVKILVAESVGGAVNAYLHEPEVNYIRRRDMEQIMRSPEHDIVVAEFPRPANRLADEIYDKGGNLLGEAIEKANGESPELIESLASANLRLTVQLKTKEQEQQEQEQQEKENRKQAVKGLLDLLAISAFVNDIPDTRDIPLFPFGMDNPFID